MDYLKELIDAATSQLGYLEKKNADINFLYDKIANAGSNNYTLYAHEMFTKYRSVFNGSKQGQPYCCTFIIWLFCSVFGQDKAQLMLKLPNNCLAARVDFFRRYLEAYGMVGTTPHVGDIVFFGDQHVGLVIFVADDKKSFKTIEANTSTTDPNVVVANGGGVHTKVYSVISRTFKFGTPDWSVVDPDYKKEVGDEVILRTLKMGSKGNDVKALQALLTGYSYDVGTIDGDFGNKTFTAVKKYQANHPECGGADGEVGINTWSSLLGV